MKTYSRLLLHFCKYQINRITQSSTWRGVSMQRMMRHADLKTTMEFYEG